MIGDHRQGLRVIPVFENLPRRRRMTARHKCRRKVRYIQQTAPVRFPGRRRFFGNRHTLVRIVNRGSEKVRHRHPAKFLPQGIPSRHGAGHGHQMDTMRGRFAADPFRLQRVNTQTFRRPARRIQPIQFLRLRIPNNGQQIAAHAVHHRLSGSQHSVGSNCGVYRAAAAIQDGGSRLGCQYLTRGDNSRRTYNGGTRLFRIFRLGRQLCGCQQSQYGNMQFHRTGAYQRPDHNATHTGSAC